MVRILALVITAAFFQAATIAGADEAGELAALRAAMASLGQAFVAEDPAAIKSLMTPEHIAIGPTYEGPVSVDEQIAMFPRIALTEYNPAEPEIELLADDVAMSRFALSLDGTLDDQPLHTRAYVTEIWVKRDGQWFQHVYQETALDGS